MMEKYGTDLDALPPTDDQIRTIKLLCEQGKQVSVPETRKQAEILIKEFEK